MQFLFNALQENNTSELASRMSAMENSTKNASEILEKLTLSYNRYNVILYYVIHDLYYVIHNCI